MSQNKLKILYVEDDSSIVEFVKILFNKYDFIELDCLSNSVDALALYKKEDIYDIVITDMIMPQMNGFELIEQIRIINPEQIVVMLSGMDDKENLIKAIEARVNFFIQKPINVQKFHKVIQDVFKEVNRNKRSELSQLLLKQYKNTIDENTIVSKADPLGKIIYVNDKFCTITGYSKDELIGKNHNIIRDPKTPSSVFKAMWHTIKVDKKTWNGEIRNRKKDGTPYWVSATISPILDMNGNVIEYIGIRTDITQQQKIKEYFQSQLKISTKQFDGALNLSKQYERCIDYSNAIIRTDTNNIITYVNDKFCHSSLYSKEELIGINCSKIRDHLHIRKGDCELIKERLSHKKTTQITFKNIRKDGSVFYMETTVHPIEDTEGNIVEHLHLMHDVTAVIELNKEIENTQKEVVFTMGAIGETRSKETGNHVKRVAEYSYLLGILAGLEENEAELIKMASPMHDIGKVGIPDAILNKPAKLTKDEFEVMKNHSQIGYEMLKGSNRPILKASSIIALEHHERWDGKGYPYGKTKEDIHIYGRITAICDVFDALGSERCYKKAWELEKILKLFKVERGQQFDPNLIDLFIDNLDRFLEIQEKYKDK